MKMLLVANITSVEIRILKTFMGNSLKMFAQSRLSFKDEKFLITKIPYQKKRDNYLFLLKICIHSKSFSHLEKRSDTNIHKSGKKEKK